VPVIQKAADGVGHLGGEVIYVARDEKLHGHGRAVSD
jgi:hypothetical protein